MAGTKKSSSPSSTAAPACCRPPPPAPASDEAAATDRTAVNARRSWAGRLVTGRGARRSRIGRRGGCSWTSSTATSTAATRTRTATARHRWPGTYADLQPVRPFACSLRRSVCVLCLVLCCVVLCCAVLLCWVETCLLTHPPSNHPTTQPATNLTATTAGPCRNVRPRRAPTTRHRAGARRWASRSEAALLLRRCVVWSFGA